MIDIIIWVVIASTAVILLLVWYYKSCRFSRNAGKYECIAKRKEIEANQQLESEIKKVQYKKSGYIFEK